MHMATESKSAAKKPAASTRKKTTKRGPTKAAALKALGLSTEDLELLRHLREARAAAEEQRRSSESVDDGSQYSSELPEVHHTKEEPTSGETVVPVFYVRNQTNCDVGLRLERQSDRSKKRVDLKPRGQRGDLQKLQEGDLDDTTLLDNVYLNVVEIITAAEAKEVISKQSTNQQQAVHPAMAALRNELGEAYDPGALHVEAEFNSQGVTVAHLTPQGGGAGALPDKGRGGIDWQAARSGPQNNVGPGGNPAIISDGFARNDTAAQADAVARRKDLEGPAAAGIRTVIVGESERS